MSASLLNVGLALAVLLLGGLAGLSRTRLSDLRDSNEELRAARDDARSDRAEVSAERDAWKTKAEHAASEVRVLQRVVTGEVRLEQIERILVEHDTKAEAAWAEILRRLEQSKRDDGVPD